jgi:hypothetical protein
MSWGGFGIHPVEFAGCPVFTNSLAEIASFSATKRMIQTA